MGNNDRKKERQLLPVEALDTAMFLVKGSIRQGPGGKPGEVIQACSKEVREALAGLKSDDVTDFRIWWFASYHD